MRSYKVKYGIQDGGSGYEEYQRHTHLLSPASHGKSLDVHMG